MSKTEKFAALANKLSHGDEYRLTIKPWKGDAEEQIDVKVTIHGDLDDGKLGIEAEMVPPEEPPS